MKKLLLGTLLSLGMTSNVFAFGASYCFDRNDEQMCAAYLSLEIVLPPLATAGTFIAASGQMHRFWKTELVLNELDKLNQTGELSPVLSSIVGQIQAQAEEKTGKSLEVSEVVREIEFNAFN